MKTVLAALLVLIPNSVFARDILEKEAFQNNFALCNAAIEESTIKLGNCIREYTKPNGANSNEGWQYSNYEFLQDAGIHNVDAGAKKKSFNAGNRVITMVIKEND